MKKLLLLLFLFACGEEDVLYRAPDAPDANGMDAGQLDPWQPAATATDAGPSPVIIPVEPGPNEFRVRMLWDPAAPEMQTDVDLHLLHPNGQRWMRAPVDCYFGNDQPIWDEIPTSSPRLDHDDTDGHGPETITLLELPPEQPGRDYRVGVHHYNDFGDGPSTIYVQIFCRGTTIQFGPVVLEPGAFWRVADVRFHPGFCVVTPVQTSSTGVAPVSHDRVR